MKRQHCYIQCYSRPPSVLIEDISVLAAAVPARCKPQHECESCPLSSVSLHAWQVVLCWWGGSIILCSSTQRGAGETRLKAPQLCCREAADFLAGWFLALWLTYPLSPLRWEATLSVLRNPLDCTVSVPFSTSSALWSRFLLSSCVLLSGGWTEALIAFAFGIAFWWMQFCSLHLFQGGLFHSIKLSVLHHVVLVILLPAQCSFIFL